MSSCDQFEAALLDEAAPRPPGFEPHLAACPTCPALAAAHREALRLRGATLSRPRARPLAEVQRRAGIVGGLMLALGGGMGLVALEFDAPAPAEQQAALPRELAAPMLGLEEQGGELFALAQLQASVSAELARDPRDDAAAVRAFGALPRWTLPARTEPMRSLGRAASPLFFTSEDSP